ncbi:MAG: alpha-ketoacid dehydrogenase subunit alpha/beta [Micrococcaceae bacterium]
MPKHERLGAGAEAVHLSTTSADWESADPQLLETMLVQLHAVRAFEEVVLSLSGEGMINGPAHSSIGQEGAAVGSVLALQGNDGVNGTHRGHHQFLAKGLHFLRPERMTMEDGVKDDDLMEFHRRTLAEIMGLSDGFSGGRGGSMHLQWLDAGALGTNAIVGGGVPLAAGNAWAQKRSALEAGEDRSGVTVTYFGDGASNIGSTLETFNMAAAWDLPLCFFLENNMYAVSTHFGDVTKEHNLALRGPGFGLKSWQVDGMDPLAVYLAQAEAVEHMATGQGATLIEAQTYRYFHQQGPFPGSVFGYRTKDEEAEWKSRDAVQRVADEMIRLKLITEEQNKDLAARIRGSLDEIVQELTEKDPESTKGGRRIIPALWPRPESVDEHIRSDLELGTLPPETTGVDDSRGTTEAKFVDVIANTLEYRMQHDDGIVVLGEDVHRLKGGTNGATRGLNDEFPGRVLGTPISENAFMGLAGGMSMTGSYRPVAELMFSDFMWVAADQIFNQIGKARHMFGGQSSMPVVLRSRVSNGTGYGSQHSMEPAGVYAMSPGWRIVAPSTAEDYIGLLNTALDIDDPVLVLEHVELYGKQSIIPAGDPDHRLEVGRAAVRRTGEDVTVLSYLNMVSRCLDVAERNELIDAEVIDLRWLDRASIDWETIGASVKKTNSVLIVEQGTQGPSYGGWLADEIQRRFFDYLDQPVARVTGTEASPTISKILEETANAGTTEIEAGFDTIAHGLERQ